MLIFIIFSVIFCFGSAFFSKLAYHAIQHGELLGAWQEVIDRLYAKPKWQWLSKPMGGCYLCFSHLWANIFFFIYCVFANIILHTWVTYTGLFWLWNGLINFVWYYTFIGGSVFLSLKIMPHD